MASSFRLELRVAFPNNFLLPKSASTRTSLLVRSATKYLKKTSEIGFGEVHRSVVCKAVANGNDKMAAADDGDEGVSLATMKLPADTDLLKFEALLFQWANSLSQGADMPLPMPLKVDKIKGGARLGFVTMGAGKFEVSVYIDCVVSAPDRANNGVSPMFRAIRNGPSRVRAPPGEARIMKSLLSALKTTVEVATNHLQ